MSRVVTVVALLLSGCASYDPPVVGDHNSAKYQADLAKCHTQAERKQQQLDNATPQSAIKAIFRSDDAEHKDELSCMVSRGYSAR